MPNFVYIMTDTQNQSMVGAYGNPAVETPNLDRLAAHGIRFDCGYTTTPLCTPARGAIFSGLYPQVNGAWTNNMAPATNVALMGTIFRHYGFRAAYTGKWHLDGSSYFGDGQPGGGFEGDWWYDGKRYLTDLGDEKATAYNQATTPDELRAAGFTDDCIWGKRVADRAIEFLETVDDEPFVLVVSFDEPHGPHVAPPDWWERWESKDVPMVPNLNAPLDGKPRLQQVARAEYGDFPVEPTPVLRRFFACNSYVDSQIGRVVDAVDRLHADDTVIIYSPDHGSQLGAHGMRNKGPFVYEETTRVPFIVRAPSRAPTVVRSPVSHLDIIPTMLELAGIEVPPALHGRSFARLLQDPLAPPHRDHAFVVFHRFAINHDQFGEFYPIRCVVDGTFKLAINLLDTDELYDLTADPYEMANGIDDPDLSGVRDGLHDVLLDEMDRIRDPFRSYLWGARPWRSARTIFYLRESLRPPPPGFPFQPKSSAD